MAFNPTQNPVLPPNTARLSNGETFIIESTGYAQRGVVIGPNGDRLFEGPETTADNLIIFETLYVGGLNSYLLEGNGPPTIEVNIPVEPTPPPPPPKKILEEGNGDCGVFFPLIPFQQKKHKS